jgi:hypothetical protein
MPYDLQGVMMNRAKMQGAEWALANCATFPELQAVNWVASRNFYEKRYAEDRILAIKMDDEINPLVPFLQDRKFAFPLGGEFLQSHDLSSFVS